jgi:hypothetical protein
MVASVKVAARAPAPRPPPFHDAELRRGWRILSQRLHLTADPASRLLRGTAVVAVAALSTRCTGVHLHLRRCAVAAVTVNGAPAPYEFRDPVAEPARVAAVTSEAARPRVDAVRAAQGALEPVCEPGELYVALPAGVSADVGDRLAAIKEAEGEAAVLTAAAASADGMLPPPVSDIAELPMFEIIVEWVVLDGGGAAEYSGGVAGGDAAVLVVDGRLGRARSWMPCVDTLNWCDRCPWEVVVLVPAHLTAVCSGDLVETRIVTEADQAAAPSAVPALTLANTAGSALALRASSRFRDRRRHSVDDDRMVDVSAGGESETGLRAAAPLLPSKRFTYRLRSAAHAAEIALAVGAFLPLADPASPAKVTHLCLPGRSRDLAHTVPMVFSQARAFCGDYFNADLPGKSFKQVFAGDGAAGAGPNCAAGGLIVYPASLLHSARCIDEGFTARVAIATAVVSAYIGVMVRPRTPEDAWFVAGLAAHVASLALMSILGKNWYRLHVNDQVRAMANESGDDAPVLAEVEKDPMFCVEKAAPSVRRRAHLIAYIIERRVGADVLRRALREVVADKKRAEAGDNPHDDALLGLNCGPFLKRVRAICGTDIRNLVRSWAASRGAPRMRFGYRYNARRHQTEFAIEQKATAYGETLSRGREGLLFQGPLCVRVMEPEGSFDHTVEVIDPVFVADLSCHCRRTKQKPATQAEKDAGEEPARIAPISWVRVDPDMEWCIDVTFIQPESAWIAMLQGERDAVAQINACRGLVEYGTEAAARALAECLANNELYWRVRAEAATSMAQCEGGLALLLDYFRSAYCVSAPKLPGGEMSANVDEKRVVSEKAKSAGCEDGGLTPDGWMPGLEANDFSDIGEYMVRRAIVRTVASVRNKETWAVPTAAADFIISLLTDDDNSRNPYDEDHYVADLISAGAEVAVVSIADGKQTTARIVELIKRFRLFDQLTPSRSGAVGAAVIVALADIEIAALAKQSRSVAHSGVESAVDCLLKCGLKPEPEIMRYVFVLSGPLMPLVARVAAFHALSRLYSGDLETVLWLLSRADGVVTGSDGISQPHTALSISRAARTEPSRVRQAALSALLEATRVRTWGKAVPILSALRRHTQRAMQVCRRIMRLAVGDGDAQVRLLAVLVAEAVWGHGIPVCLLDESGYKSELQRAIQAKLRKVQQTKEKAAADAKSSGRGPEVSRKASKSGSARDSEDVVDENKPAIVRPVPPRSQSGVVAKKMKSSSSGGGAPKPRAMSESPAKGVKVEKTGSGSGVQKTARAPRPPSAERPPLGVPATPAAQPSLRLLDVDLKMTKEDKQYLTQAWTEYKEATFVAAPPVAAVTARKIQPPRQPLNWDRVSNCGPIAPAVAEAVLRDGGSDREENDERRTEKERKKKKKKKRRRDEREPSGEHGRGERDEDGSRKKKKKKKQKHHHHRSEGGDHGADRSDAPYASGVVRLAAPSMSNGGIPTSEGSIRSEGKSLSVKISLKGMNSSQLSIAR